MQEDQELKIIKGFTGFIQQYKRDIIRQSMNTDVIVIDLNFLLEYDYQLYDSFIQGGEDYYGMLKSVITEEFGLKEILIKNVPESENIVINNIRTEDIGRLVSLKAMVKRKSDVYPKVTNTYYLCTNTQCSYSQDSIKVPQIEDEERILKSCPKCKSAVDKLQEEKVDFQTIMVEEMSEDLDNSNIQPKSKVVHLEGALTTPQRDNNIIVGSKVEVIGFVREKKKKVNNKYSVKSDFYIQAYNVNLLEEKLYDIELSQSEIQEFYSYPNTEDFKQKIVSSIAPQLYGLDNEKLAVLLSILGGSENEYRRSNIHVLIVGDPSQGKSKLINYVAELMPRTKYVSGEGSSGVGLTASAVKDEMSGQWMPEAGAVVQANNGYLLIDELDKVKISEQTKLNTALEDGRVVLDKASVSVDMKANATAIACANPMYGKFDLHQDISKQIKIDRALRSRFDLLLTLFDEHNTEQDEAIADSIFHDVDSQEWDIDTLRRYLILAKQKNPKHSRETSQLLKNYYLKIRKCSENNDVSISVRQLEGLRRLSEAHAKLYLRDEVLVDDCEAVISLMEYCHKKYGVSDYMTGISSRSRSKNQLLHSIIEKYRLEHDKEFTIEELHVEAGKDYKYNEIEKFIKDLKLAGEIYEPRKNLYRLF